MIGKHPFLCSCITTANCISNKVSPWSYCAANPNYTHVKCGPGYLEDISRESRRPFIAVAINNSKCSMNKSFTSTKRKPSANDYKFSHLEPEEYIASYRKGYCSVSTSNTFSHIRSENSLTHASLEQHQYHQTTNPRICSATLQSAAKPQLIKQVQLNLLLNKANPTPKPTTALLHEINLVIPKTVVHRQIRPSPDLWYTAMQPAVINIKGTPDQVYSKIMTERQSRPATAIRKQKPPVKSTVYINLTEHLNSLHSCPIYGTVKETVETPMKEIATKTKTSNKNRKEQFTNQYLPNTINAVKSMEQGFKELYMTKPIEIDTNSGRLLSAKMRAKSDIGAERIENRSDILTGTLIAGKQMKTPGGAKLTCADTQKPTECPEQVESVSTPNLMKVCIRQPPNLVYLHKTDIPLMIGNPERFKEATEDGHSNDNVEQKSSKVNYRVSLDDLTKQRWRRERKSSCFKRSSQRRSKKWFYLNDSEEIEHVMGTQEQSIAKLNDIINAE